MPQGFLPNSDAGLLAWSANFSTLITVAPTSYGLVAGDASSYATKHAAYASALTVATEPGTRTKVTVATKKAARDVLSLAARALSKRVQGTTSVTDAQKTALGLDVREPATPIQPPDDAPVASIKEMNGWMVKVQIRGLGADRRGKPTGVAGANIFSFVGAVPPADPKDWDFEGDTSKTIFEVAFPEDLAVGTRVWICVAWKNPRFQSGPACAPIGLVIGGGLPETVIA